MEQSDHELVTTYLQGDESALPALVARHLKPVLNFVYRLVGNRADAEDITQETFFKAWKSLKKYNKDKSFKTWIFTIARNTAIDALRKRKEVVFSQFDTDGGNVLIDTLPDPEPLPDELFARIGDAENIDRVLKELSSAAREVIVLRYHEDLTFDEIGRILGKPLHTVKSQHRRALLALKKLLDAPK